jgi:hypothetical protein
VRSLYARDPDFFLRFVREHDLAQHGALEALATEESWTA